MGNCASAALCLSPEGELSLKAYFERYATDHPEQAEDLRMALFAPGDDPYIEIHHKEQCTLRIWSAVKWGLDLPLTRFVHRLFCDLDTEEYTFCFYEHEVPEGIRMKGEFDENPFGLTFQRRFIFIDADDTFQTSRNSQAEICRYLRFHGVITDCQAEADDQETP